MQVHACLGRHADSREAADTSARFAAAKPLSWRGRGDVFQAPWTRCLPGLILCVDFGADAGSSFLALLSTGSRSTGVFLCQDPDFAMAVKGNFPHCVVDAATSDIGPGMLDQILKRRDVRSVLLRYRIPAAGTLRTRGACPTLEAFRAKAEGRAAVPNPDEPRIPQDEGVSVQATCLDTASGL